MTTVSVSLRPVDVYFFVAKVGFDGIVAVVVVLLGVVNEAAMYIHTRAHSF